VSVMITVDTMQVALAHLHRKYSGLGGGKGRGAHGYYRVWATRRPADFPASHL
jgi:hypothetical protein